MAGCKNLIISPQSARRRGGRQRRLASHGHRLAVRAPRQA